MISCSIDSCHCVLGPPTQGRPAEGGSAGHQGGCIWLLERYPVQYRLECPRDPCWLRRNSRDWWGHVLPGRLPRRFPHRPVSVLDVLSVSPFLTYIVFKIRSKSSLAYQILLSIPSSNQTGEWLSNILNRVPYNPELILIDDLSQIRKFDQFWPLTTSVTISY